MTISAVRIRGSFHGPTGHDHHVRSFTRELARAGVAVQLTDMPEWSARRLPVEQRDPWFDSLHHDVGASVLLQFCMPHQVVNIRGLTPVNFTMFEGDQIPDGWRRAASRSVLTILPEMSSYEAWLAGGVSAERLRLCPLGIDPQLFAQNATPIPLIGDSGDFSNRAVRFLNLSENVPRKNQKGLLRAWLRATDSSDDAVLVIKPGGLSPGHEDHLSQVMGAIELEEGRRFSEAAPIHIVLETFAEEEMPRLYASATHYISMSFGEGWDLPMMEAAAAGLQLIAPDHSAYRSYLNTDIATLLPSRAVPADVPESFKILFAHAQWWQPDIDAAVAAIRNAIAGRDTTVASARDFVLGHYTWENATRRLIGILTEAEQMEPFKAPSPRSSHRVRNG